jgi:hypothetical protein
MNKVTLLTRDEYLFSMRKRIDELQARSNQPFYKYAEREQAKVIAHFIDRGIQLGESAFRTRDLPVPLDSLMRILCDDLIRLFWVSQSEANASEHVKTTVSQWVKIARVNIEKGYAQVTHKTTGKNVNAEVLPKMAATTVKGKTIEQIADECGLERVYNIPFRLGSLSVHGNTFPLNGKASDSVDNSLSALPAIIALLRAITLIADNFPDRLTKADEVLQILRIHAPSSKAG